MPHNGSIMQGIMFPLQISSRNRLALKPSLGITQVAVANLGPSQSTTETKGKFEQVSQTQTKNRQSSSQEAKQKPSVNVGSFHRVCRESNFGQKNARSMTQNKTMSYLFVRTDNREMKVECQTLSFVQTTKLLSKLLSKGVHKSR